MVVVVVVIVVVVVVVIVVVLSDKHMHRSPGAPVLSAKHNQHLR